MAEYMFRSGDFLRRGTPINFYDLPTQCCAKCENWIKSDGRVMSKSENEWNSSPGKFVFGYGCCTKASDLEWDAFTWADDVCDEFSEDTDGEELEENDRYL